VPRVAWKGLTVNFAANSYRTDRLISTHVCLCNKIIQTLNFVTRNFRFETYPINEKLYFTILEDPTTNNTVIFQVLTVVLMKITAFWDIASCSLVEIDRRFRGAYCLWKVGQFLPDYKTKHPKRQPSSYLPPWEPEISAKTLIGYRNDDIYTIRLRALAHLSVISAIAIEYNKHHGYELNWYLNQQHTSVHWHSIQICFNETLWFRGIQFENQLNVTLPISVSHTDSTNRSIHPNLKKKESL
jgi:hypothetical protein